MEASSVSFMAMGCSAPNNTNTTNNTGLVCENDTVPNYEYTMCINCTVFNCAYCMSSFECALCETGYSVT